MSSGGFHQPLVLVWKAWSLNVEELSQKARRRTHARTHVHILSYPAVNEVEGKSVCECTELSCFKCVKSMILIDSTPVTQWRRPHVHNILIIVLVRTKAHTLGMFRRSL